MGLSVHDPFIDPLGNPLGLARTNDSAFEALLVQPTILTLTNGTYLIDKQKYKFFRVTTVGKGGDGSYGNGSCGGGGGGTAQSLIIPVAGRTIEILTSVVAGEVTASFLDVVQVGKPGGAGGLTASIGGMGVGGAYNFKGGDGLTYGGAGAAGTRGNGGNSSQSGTQDGGGGGAGNNINGSINGGGGGGVGAAGMATSTGGSIITSQQPGQSNNWGQTPMPAANGYDLRGGGWGGGGGSYAGSFNSNYLNTGGFGATRVELW